MQATAMVGYTALIGAVMFNGNTWFGQMHSFFGPMAFLALFVASALISALIILGYPFWLFYIDKKKKEAFKIVVYSTGWLILYVIVFLASFLIFK